MPQIVQWYGFNRVLILLCIFEWFLDMNFIPHSAPGFRFSLAWLFIWLHGYWKWILCHTEHINMVFFSMNLYVPFLLYYNMWCCVLLYIPNFICMARNHTYIQYIFYVAFPVTFFTLFIVIQVSFKS